MVDRVGYAPTTSRMSSEHSTIELTGPKFKILNLDPYFMVFRNQKFRFI